MATMHLRNIIVPVFLFGSALALTGCVYRFYGPIPPSQELVQIVDKTPEQYVLQVDDGSVKRQYEVPRDGRVKIAIRSYRFPCGVYLLGTVKVGGYADPLKAWSISITRNGATVRKLSVRAVLKLSTDQAGYHVLKLKD